MAFLPWPWPFFLFPLSALAGPLSTVSLPDSLASAVPACAQACVASFILQNFQSSCHNIQDFNCLCTHNGVSGFTVGEGALRCLASTCYDPYPKEKAVGVYEVCSDVPNAEPMTHRVLTATHSTASTRTIDTHFIPISQTSHSTHVRSTTSSTHTRTSRTSTSTSHPASPTSTKVPSTSAHSSHTPTISPTTHTSSSPAPAATTSSAAAAPAPSLSNPQIAGITVGGFGAAALACGAVFLCFFLRRRSARKRRDSGSSFGDRMLGTQEGSPETLPGFARNDNETSQEMMESHWQAEPQDPLRGDNSRWSSWRRSARPENGAARLGLAPEPTSERRREHSPPPPSAASYRTTSQLLPDKPTYTLFPPRQRPFHGRPFPATDSSAGTYPPNNPLAVVNPSEGEYPRTLAANAPHSGPRGANTHNSWSRSPQKLRLDTSAVDNQKWSKPVETLRKPVPARHSPHTSVLLESRGLPRPPLASGVHPTERHKESEIALQRFPNNRTIRHLSSDSDTSFEDADDRDPVSALSPVEESPQRRHPTLIIAPPVVPARSTRRPPSEPVSATTPYAAVSIPDIAELPDTPVRSKASSSRSPRLDEDDGARPTAKYKILVESGKDGIEGPSTPHTPRTPHTPHSARSEEWPPALPTTGTNINRSR